MKRASKTFTFLATAVAMLFITSASANNGIQRYDFEFDEGPAWIECLGEFVNLHHEVSVATHDFVTPSGIFHLIDNWHDTVTAIGLSTSYVWVGHNVSPFQMNIGPSEVNQYVFKGVAEPVIGDGPKLFINTLFKVTVNANGVLVVDRPVEPFSDRIRCLGPKK